VRMSSERPKRPALARGAGRRLLLIAFAWACLVPGPVTSADYRLTSIATGGRTGVYYFAGGELCGYVNAHRWSHGIRCVAERTDGSIDNLQAIRAGRADFAIVQSDWQYHAVTGTSVFEGAGPDRELRALASLYPEHFTVVARPGAGIASFQDLLGKRVNLGPLGSGGRATMDLVMAQIGWDEADFSYMADLAMDAVPEALCAGEVDAAVFIVAHPNLTVETMSTECGAELVPVTGPEIDAMVSTQPYYFRTEIPAGTYAHQAGRVPTFALGATLVTSARTSPLLVETVVGALFGNLDAFRAAHPAFSDLNPASMVNEGLTAPLHEGALEYFRKQGLPQLPRPEG
jgi:uncharacterized protein